MWSMYIVSAAYIIVICLLVHVKPNSGIRALWFDDIYTWFDLNSWKWRNVHEDEQDFVHMGVGSEIWRLEMQDNVFGNLNIIWQLSPNLSNYQMIYILPKIIHLGKLESQISA